MGYALVLISMGKLKEAHNFATLALTVNQRYPSPRVDCKIPYLYGFVMVPWNQHWEEMDPYLRHAQRLGQKYGDTKHTAFAMLSQCELYHPQADLTQIILLGPTVK